jgi:hypothetical protein
MRNQTFWGAAAVVAIVCSLGSVAGGVRAQEGGFGGSGTPLGSFVLATDKFSEKAAAVLNHLARENFTRASEFSLLDVRAFLEEDAGDPRLAALQKARDLLRGGKEQYDNLELDAAIDELNKSIEEFRKAAGRLGGGEEYLEALLYLGAAHILSGDNERGTESFRTVAMFDKRKVLDPKVFPPSMIEIFDKTKEDVTASPVGTVLVKSNPSAAEVYLSGVFKGITPLTLVKIPEGSHFIRVEKDGYTPWGQQVEFYATHEETAEANLKETLQSSKFSEECKRILSDLDEDPPKKAVIQFGEWLRVEQLVLASVKQRGDEVVAEAVLVQLQPPKKLAFKTTEFNLTSANFLARADAFFSSLYRKVEIPAAEGGGKKDTPLIVAAAKCHSDSDCSTGEVCDNASGSCIPYAPEGEQWYEKWWFWTIVGGGLAVAGGTTLLVWYLMQPDVGAIEFSF